MPSLPDPRVTLAQLHWSRRSGRSECSTGINLTIVTLSANILLFSNCSLNIQLSLGRFLHHSFEMQKLGFEHDEEVMTPPYVLIIFRSSVFAKIRIPELGPLENQLFLETILKS